MPPFSPGDALTSSDDALGTAHWYNLVIASNGGPLRFEHVTVLEHAYRRVASCFPTGTVGLFVVGPNGVPTPPAVRRSLGEMLRRLGPGLRHVAVVLTGSDVWILMCRTLLRGVGMLWGCPGGFSVHGSVEEACRHLLPLVRDPVGLEVATSEISMIVRELQTRIYQG
jgi:hypothetical protein